MIIFVATCESCHKIHLMLNELNILSTPLHSKITQSQRTSSLARFRGGAVPILVATDVASRGLDIPLVDCVINFDLPLKEDDYIHRVGRTARAGGLGKSLTIVSQFDVKRFLNIEKRISLNL
ncbi:uncharacterized protein LOC135143494 [Zophobas morio]|uniref:uncharacterized protein LOC135143494 n=1 Tax=Zophobas morio TaxID=2755281 RepID=UPI003082805D